MPQSMQERRENTDMRSWSRNDAQKLTDHSQVKTVEYNDGNEYAEVVVVFETGIFSIDFIRQYGLSFREAWITERRFGWREYLDTQPRLAARFLVQSTESGSE